MMPVKSPVINEDNTVTFHYVAAKAKKVSVTGAFNDWKILPMVKKNGNIWTVTTPVLEEGTYTYLFVADGTYLPDQLNPVKSGVKKIESVFDIGQGDYYIPTPFVKDESSQRSSPLMGEGVNSNDFFNDQLIIVTLNTHSLQEKTKRFEKLRYIAQGLKNIQADIIALNEIVYGNIYARGYEGQYYDSLAIIKKYLEDMTGEEYFTYVEPFAQWDEGEKLANAILSRYPLYDSDYIELTTTDFWPAPKSNRNCIYSKINLPEKGDLNIFVTHPMGYEYDDTGIQIEEIKIFVQAKTNDSCIGSIIMGDFNVPYKHRNYLALRNEDPYFTDTADIALLDSPTTIDNHRIDYIFWADGQYTFKDLKTSSHIIFNDSYYKNNYYPVVSDHFGVVTDIRIYKSASFEDKTDLF